MNSAERFQKPTTEDGENREPGREVDAGRRTRTRTTRRFEIGFFVRRIRNGEVIFYRTFPAYKDKDKREEEEPVVQRAMMMSAPGTAPAEGEESEEPTFQPLSGPGQGNTDPGPVGGTSTKVEIGFFAGTTTVTTTDED